MVVGLLISSSGKIKEIMIKSKEEDYYKLVNLKNSDGFELKHKWSVELDKKYKIHVYARTNGKVSYVLQCHQKETKVYIPKKEKKIDVKKLLEKIFDN